jgi:hypothetical protein
MASLRLLGEDFALVLSVCDGKNQVYVPKLGIVFKKFRKNKVSKNFEKIP